jgi:hypothetical protein
MFLAYNHPKGNKAQRAAASDSCSNSRVEFVSNLANEL